MDLFLIILIVIVLYWRTINYHYLIDDIVRRWGYLLEIPDTSPPPDFYSSKPRKSRHLFLTLTHCVNVSIIYFLWGWKAALLFAMHPLSVSCTAWITGGYYQITVFFTLVTFYFISIFPGVWGILLGATFFTAALGSTVNCIAIPFIFLIQPPITGLALMWPLFFYLTGRRFRIGFKKRNTGKGDKFSKGKFALMPKVLGYYIKMVLVPNKLAFFQDFGHEYGKNPQLTKKMESIDQLFWESIGIFLVFAGIGFYLSPLGILIFLAGIMPFTQWKVLGQFVAERYMYLPLIGFCLIVAQLPWPIVIVLAGTYLYRSNKYIPAFFDITALYRNGIEQFPNCVSNYVNLAERNLHLGKLFEAYKLLKQGLAIDPDSFLCHANMAAYWISINKPEIAKYHTIKAMKNAENRGAAYNIFKNQLFHIMQGMKHMAEARDKMDKVCKQCRVELGIETETQQNKNDVIQEMNELCGIQ